MSIVGADPSQKSDLSCHCLAAESVLRQSQALKTQTPPAMAWFSKQKTVVKQMGFSNRILQTLEHSTPDDALAVDCAPDDEGLVRGRSSRASWSDAKRNYRWIALGFYIASFEPAVVLHSLSPPPSP